MKRMVFGLGALLAALTAVAASTAFAQPAASAATPAAPIDGKATVAALRQILTSEYVLPETRPRLDQALARGLAAGRYDVGDPAVLAERINTDMAAVTPDKHLGIRFAPEEAAELAVRPLGHHTDDGPPTPRDVLAAQRHNHGLVQMKLLPGNVRYLDTEGFIWAGEASAEAYANAMRFLAGGDAVIIDMRHNGGGSPDAVRYMISHFLSAGKPLVTFYMGSATPDRFSTLDKLEAPRMVGKPLYVLTSRHTASAAEEFSGHVAGFKLGELVGETTAGAGFRNSFFALPGGFVVSVSVGRAVLASTGKDWEGVGIVPTDRVDADKALSVAQIHALRRLAPSAGPARKAALEATAALLSAQIDPVKTALPLTAYAGTFGERTIAVDGGNLVFSRDDTPRRTLVAIGPNRFVFEDNPGTRLDFEVSGTAVTGFEIVRDDGSRATAKRTPA